MYDILINIQTKPCCVNASECELNYLPVIVLKCNEQIKSAKKILFK